MGKNFQEEYFSYDSSSDSTLSLAATDSWSTMVEPFPLLLLPVEIIILILSFLPTADRLRSRINRKLFQTILKIGIKLEAGEEYAVPSMRIDDDPVNITTNDQKLIKQGKLIYFKLTKSIEYYLDGLHKLSKNVEFESITLSIESQNYRGLISKINAIRAESLTILLRWGILSESTNTNQWMNRKILKIIGITDTPGSLLLRLFETMKSEGSRLFYAKLCWPSQQACLNLLHLLGITYRDGQFHSNRREAEIFVLRSSANEEDEKREELQESQGRFLIVAGSMKISVMKEILTTTPDNEEDDISFVLCFERFNEDGSIPDDPIAKSYLKHPITDIRRRTNDFEKLAVVYS